MPAQIHGDADDGFGAVADAFAANFTDHGELGAALVVYVGGRKVVDLWGGIADRADRAPLVRDDAGGRLLRDQGRARDLRLPAGCAGPARPRRTGRPVLARVRAATARRRSPSACSSVTGQDCRRSIVRLSCEEVLAWEPVIAAIEEQQPLWQPGTGHSYHTMTYGWLIGEVIRRVSGRQPGRVSASRALPTRWDLTCGSARRTRSSNAPHGSSRRWATSDPVRGAVIADWLANEPVAERAGTMGGAFGFPLADGEVTFNDPAIQTSRDPRRQRHGHGRGLARLYAACVSERRRRTAS